MRFRLLFRSKWQQSSWPVGAMYRIHWEAGSWTSPQVHGGARPRRSTTLILPLQPIALPNPIIGPDLQPFTLLHLIIVRDALPLRAPFPQPSRVGSGFGFPALLSNVLPRCHHSQPPAAPSSQDCHGYGAMLFLTSDLQLTQNVAFDEFLPLATK